MMTDSEKKIGRPRQLYNGAIDLDYVPIEKR
jgi:citrate synthase